MANEAAALRFGENLRLHRRRANLNQDRLARLAGLHRTAPSLLENGLREPRLMTIVKLATVLKVTPNDLTYGIDWLVVEGHQQLGVVLINGRPVELGSSADDDRG